MSKFLCVLFVLLLSAFAAGEESECPHHSDHSKNVDERGDHVMGFDHQKTIHHFQLKTDGGIISAEAKDTDDSESIEQIRKHFVEIAGLFARGDFSKPEKIHGRVPPGVPEMIRFSKEIRYSAHETPKGGEVRIHTTNAEALKAVHAFLSFQIEDHRTGDPLTVQ